MRSSTSFLRDCCLLVMRPVHNVYIAAVTESKTRGRAPPEGNRLCVVNTLWSSSFASGRVALGPSAPYWFAKAILGI